MIKEKKLMLLPEVKQHLRSLMNVDMKTFRYRIEWEESYLGEQYKEYQEGKRNIHNVFSYFTISESNSRTSLGYLIKLSLKDCCCEDEDFKFDYGKLETTESKPN